MAVLLGPVQARRTMGRKRSRTGQQMTTYQNNVPIDSIRFLIWSILSLSFATLWGLVTIPAIPTPGEETCCATLSASKAQPRGAWGRRSCPSKITKSNGAVSIRFLRFRIAFDCANAFSPMKFQCHCRTRALHLHPLAIACRRHRPSVTDAANSSSQTLAEQHNPKRKKNHSRNITADPDYGFVRYQSISFEICKLNGDGFPWNGTFSMGFVWCPAIGGWTRSDVKVSLDSEVQREGPRERLTKLRFQGENVKVYFVEKALKHKIHQEKYQKRTVFKKKHNHKSRFLLKSLLQKNLATQSLQESLAQSINRFRNHSSPVKSNQDNEMQSKEIQSKLIQIV